MSTGREGGRNHRQARHLRASASPREQNRGGAGVGFDLAQPERCSGYAAAFTFACPVSEFGPAATSSTSTRSPI